MVVFNHSATYLADCKQVYLHRAAPQILHDAAPYLPSRKLLNKAQHATNGNRHRLGVRACSWNCNRGLLDEHGHASAKVAEINNFLSSNSVHLMAIIEAGIHGANSLTARRTPMTLDSIHRELTIPGYSIQLPEIWHMHETAQMLLYVRKDIHIKVISTPKRITDLPLLSVAAKRGAESRTIFNFFYREYTDRLTRMLKH